MKPDFASISERLETDTTPSGFDHAAWPYAFGSVEWPTERYDPSQIAPPVPSLSAGGSTIASSSITVPSNGGRSRVARKRTQDGRRRPNASDFNNHSRDADMEVSQNASIRNDNRENDVPEEIQALLVDTFAKLIIQALHDDVPKALLSNSPTAFCARSHRC